MVGLVPMRGHAVINDAPRSSPGNRVWPPWNAGQVASEWPVGMALRASCASETPRLTASQRSAQISLRGKEGALSFDPILQKKTQNRLQGLATWI